MGEKQSCRVIHAFTFIQSKSWLPSFLFGILPLLLLDVVFAFFLFPAPQVLGDGYDCLVIAVFIFLLFVFYPYFVFAPGTRVV